MTRVLGSPQERESAKTHKVVPGRSSGQIVANKNRLQALLTLMDIRGGGFARGCRGMGAWIYAMCLCRRRVPIEDAIRQVRAYGRECSPPFSAGECDAQTRAGYKPAQLRWPYRKIAAVLGVTKAESEVISQRIKKPFPSADGEMVALTRLDGGPKQGEITALRRAMILRVVSELGYVPASRRMEALLKERGQDNVSYPTICTDYKVLCLKSQRAPKYTSAAFHQLGLDI